MTEILTPAEMYQADALAVSAGIPSLTLMENAGRAVCDAIVRHYSKGPVAILCGPGNNGGDGYVAARLLAARKWPVTVFRIGEHARQSGDAAKMAARWKKPVGTLADFTSVSGKKMPPRLIVDAIFGAGLNRDFPQEIADAVARAACPVVSIDVPSGMDGMTGLPRGTCLKADLTVTFFRKKPAHVLLPGRAACGRVEVADIGIPASVLSTIAPLLFENAAPRLPSLAVDTHKYKRGHALIWSGPEFNTGASRLAALACARSGAGLTTIVGTPEALRVHAHHLTSIMLKPMSELDGMLADRRVTALCMGPAAGISPVLKSVVLKVLMQKAAVVLDADALTVFADDPATLFTAIKSKPGAGVVITPHEGEFLKLFSSFTSEIDSKVERARAAAQCSGTIVVLKGPDTVIAAPSGKAAVNINAPPKLATAGSGDVLAGLVTGLMAQDISAFEAACAAVWLHAEAGNRCARRTVIAEDLIEGIGW